MRNHEKTKTNIIGIEEEIKLKSTENNFNKMKEETFPAQRKICISVCKKLTEHQIDWFKEEYPCNS